MIMVDGVVGLCQKPGFFEKPGFFRADLTFG
jgi:hypothetical protein